jgi:hypothetical protein
MPRRNRVTPLGELIAVPARGLVYGNRGCLHDAHAVIRRPYAGKRWIACRLSFRDRRRQPLMAPGRYTELFFLDDATALAAGHRPCAECRRVDYARLLAVWSDVHPGQVGADAIDEQLHAERVARGTRERTWHDAPLDDLPNGSFILLEGAPWLVLGSELLRWSPTGYTDRRPRPRRCPARLVTPPSLLELLRADWRPVVPLLHPSVRSQSAISTAG